MKRKILFAINRTIRIADGTCPFRGTCLGNGREPAEILAANTLME